MKRRAPLALAVAAALAVLVWWLWPAPPSPLPEPAPDAAAPDAAIEDAGQAITADVVRESELDDDPWDDDGGIDYDEDDVEEAAEDDEPPQVLDPQTVAGVVLDSHGQPASGADVRLEPSAFPRVVHSGPVTTRADAKGHFKLENVLAESGALHAQLGDEGADVALELPLERPLVVKLAATGAIDMTVIDSRGKPMAGLAVMLLANRDVLGRGGLTGDDGVVHFEAVAAGSWSPQVVKYNASWGVRVQAGQRTAVTAKIDEDVDIVGRVVSEAGPLERLLIEANLVDAGFTLDGMSGARTDGDGGFVVPVHAGRWVLTTHHPKWGYARATVDAPGPPVELRLGAPAALEGTVVDSNGAPAESFKVRVAPTAAEVDNSLENRTTRADGRFKFSHLPPGDTVVEATRDGDGRKARVTANLSSGRATEITLHLPAGSRLTGRVIDDRGQPVAGADVNALWDQRHGDAYLRSGQNGEFDFQSLPGDTVELDASKKGLARARVKDLPIPQEHYELVMHDAVKVTGRVVDGSGAPVTKFAVDGRTFSNDDGSFELEPREPGLAALTLEVPGAGQSLWAYETQAGVSADLGTFTVLPRPPLKVLLRGKSCQHCAGMLMLGPPPGKFAFVQHTVFEDPMRPGQPVGFDFDTLAEPELPWVGNGGFWLQAAGMVDGAVWQHVYPLSPGLNVLEITAGSP